jgi:hypothetical protein
MDNSYPHALTNSSLWNGGRDAKESRPKKIACFNTRVADPSKIILDGARSTTPDLR